MPSISKVTCPEGSQRRFVVCSYRLRFDSNPRVSIAASVAYIIGKDCVQFFTVDRSLSYYAALRS
jgi:hypothetical protein